MTVTTQKHSSYKGLKKLPKPSNTIIITLGEYAVTKSDDKNPVLATFGITDCGCLVVYDPDEKVGGLAHIDASYKLPETFTNMLEDLKSLGGKKYSVWFKPDDVEDLIRRRRIQNYAELWERILKCKFKPLPVPEFSFDTRNGEFYLLDDSQWNQANLHDLESRTKTRSEKMRRVYFSSQ